MNNFQTRLEKSNTFAKDLPPAPGKYNCRFIYPAQPGDTNAIGKGYTNTLIFADEHCPDGQKVRMVEYQRSIGANCFPWVFANPDGRVYPTINGVYGAKIDRSKLQQWYDRNFACIVAYGVWPIPCGYCCENSSEDYAKWDQVEIDRIAKAVVGKLDPITPFWCLVWEGNKFWKDPNKIETLCQIYRQYTKKPLTIHIQSGAGGKHGWEMAVAPSVDGVILEWSWHPKYGESKSVETILKEGWEFFSHLPGKAAIAGEWTLYSDKQKAREQRTALLKAPIYGAWN